MPSTIINDFSTRLASDLSSTATVGGVISVTTAFPTEHVGKTTRVRIGSEILNVTITTTTTLTIIEREAESADRYPKASWPTTTRVTPVLTEEGLTDLISATAVSEVLVGRTLFVDAVNGDVGTATRGELTAPYLTIGAAVTAAQVADVVEVGPGTWNARNVAKVGVHLKGSVGADLVCPADFFNDSAVIDDTVTGANGALTGRIIWPGLIHAESRSFGGDPATIHIANTGTNLSLKAGRITHAPGSSQRYAVFHENGTLVLDADSVEMYTANAIYLAAIWWAGGRGLYTVKSIKSTSGTQAGVGLYMDGATADDCYVYADLIEAAGAEGVAAFSTNANASARSWVVAHELRAPATAASIGLYVQKGKYYGTHQKISGNVPILVGGGEGWVICEKVTVSAGGAGTVIGDGLGTIDGFFIDNQQWEDLGATGPVLTLNAANAYVRGGRMKLAATTAMGLSLNAGTASSLDIDASASATGNPVKVTASGAVLRNCTLKAANGRYAITADSAVTLVIDDGVSIDTSAGGLGIHSNVTVTRIGRYGVHLVDGTANTQSPGTNDTTIANTAFVTAAVSLAVTGLLDFKGTIDAGANPNYPAALQGDAYIISVAGTVGGGSGKAVNIGDFVIAIADNAGGTEASVGTSWAVLEHNILSLGTAAFKNTGTSGDAVGLLNTANTWSAAQTVIASADAVTPASIRQFSGTQSASLLTFTDSTGATVLSNVDASGNVVVPVGSSTVPGLRFLGSLTTGLGLSIAEVQIICGGVNAAKIGTTRALFTGQIIGPAGAVGAPSIYLASDSTTGLYRAGSNQIGFTVSSALKMQVDSTGASVAGVVGVNTLDAATNTLSNPLTLRHNSTGTAAAGFGGATLYQLESSTTDSQDAVQFAAAWTVATHASRTSEARIYTVTNAGALAEVARFDKGGGATPSAANTGFMLWDVDNATLERVTVGAADSGGAGFKVLRIPN